MGGMLVRRLALLVPMLLGITFIAFMLGELSPSDPAEVSRPSSSPRRVMNSGSTALS